MTWHYYAPYCLCQHVHGRVELLSAKARAFGHALFFARAFLPQVTLLFQQQASIEAARSKGLLNKKASQAVFFAGASALQGAHWHGSSLEVLCERFEEVLAQKTDWAPLAQASHGSPAASTICHDVHLGKRDHLPRTLVPIPNFEHDVPTDGPKAHRLPAGNAYRKSIYLELKCRYVG